MMASLLTSAVQKMSDGAAEGQRERPEEQNASEEG
jgi:hypothetical protein